MSARLAIGIGARRGVAADEIVEVVELALAALLPSPACGRRWPGAAGSDEGRSGFDDLADAFPFSESPHPTLADARATFSRKREKEGSGEIALFTIDSKKDEAGLRQAAALMNMRIMFLPLAALLVRRDELLTRSPRVEALTGVGSVAEAAALAGAGAGSALLGPRVAAARATCAIARNALDGTP